VTGPSPIFLAQKEVLELHLDPVNNYTILEFYTQFELDSPVIQSYDLLTLRLTHAKGL